MTAHHTEGPWALIAGNHEDHWFIVAGEYADQGEPELHAEIVTPNPSDVRAMAAAPELLGAMERLLATTEPGTEDAHEPGCRCVIHGARAAIAKAKGEA